MYNIVMGVRAKKRAPLEDKRVFNSFSVVYFVFKGKN